MARSQFLTGEYIVWGTVHVDTESRAIQHYIECAGSRHIATGLATTGTWFRPKNIETCLRTGVVEVGKTYRFTLERSSLHFCWIKSANGAETSAQAEQMRREAEQAKQAAKQSMPERQAEASTYQSLRPMFEPLGLHEAQRLHAERQAIANAFEIPAAMIAETVESVTYEPVAAAPESQLNKLVAYMAARNHQGHHLNVMMVGPAGCGKSTMARIAAESLGLPFYFTSFSRDTPPWELTGRAMPGVDGTWQYQASEFVKAYECGGVWLGDEFDAADANTLLVLNAALANGSMVVPGRENAVIHRHADFIALAAANTYGSGSRVYVGREELDEATMDRFLTITVDYDKQYEAQLMARYDHGQEVGKVIHAIRTVINGTAGEKPLRRTCSTRRIIDWTAAIEAGRELGELLTEYFASWSVVDRQKVMSNAAIREAVSSRTVSPAVSQSCNDRSAELYFGWPVC